MSQAEVLSYPNDPIAVIEDLAPLSAFQRGDRGVIVHVGDPDADGDAWTADELERRLLEFGFVEGATVELLHQGMIGGDPIAVRLDDMRVALRRRDAQDVWVRFEPDHR